MSTHFSNLSGQPDIFLESGTFKKSGTLLFSKSRVPDFFSGSQTDPGFHNKNSGCRLTGGVAATMAQQWPGLGVAVLPA